jgi:hypothetical protein
MSTALVRAVESNLTALYVVLSQWPEIELHRDEDRTWTISARRFSLCNVVLEARFAGATIDAQIDRALRPYQGSDVNVMWKLGPSAQPAELGARLVTRGFLALPTLHGMALDLGALGPLSPDSRSRRFATPIT